MSVPLRERLARMAGITVTNIGLLDRHGRQQEISLSIQGTDLAELQRLCRADGDAWPPSPAWSTWTAR
jgi:HAE1 family hydrophobic/amphiphilic exporter-1